MTRARSIAQAGVIAAVYAAVTLVVLQLPGQLGWGLIQFRVSEAVTVLALFTPAAIPGLAIGAALANLFNVGQAGPVALLDVVFGSLGTLLGAMWTWRMRKRTWLALLGPVVSNALIVPAYLPAMLAAMGITGIPFLGIGPSTAWPLVYGAGVLTVGIGQAVVLYGLGWPLAAALRSLGLARVLDTERVPGAD
ncbi:MAG TPA: QueT transporter family protein [Coriobacteriia bacterium]